MRRSGLLAALALTVAAVGPFAGGDAALAREEHQRTFAVVHFEFDPDHTGIVAAAWLRHLGLPDEHGKGNFGFIVSKNGDTKTNASAGARLVGIRGAKLTDLGYDWRNGGHCGNGAPRFNVVTSDNVLHFVGCNSPVPLVEPAPATADGLSPNPGWKRFHWGPAQLAAAFPPIAAGSTVRSISIVFDEGVDTGPDNSGMAVLDNIRVNDMFVGKPGNGKDRDEHDED